MYKSLFLYIFVTKKIFKKNKQIVFYISRTVRRKGFYFEKYAFWRKFTNVQFLTSYYFGVVSFPSVLSTDAEGVIQTDYYN